MIETSIDGMVFHPLVAHRDQRGTLAEVHRDDRGLPVRPVQWNVVHSDPGVLRGVHCHLRHCDLLNIIAGELILGLVDLRMGSPTFRVAEIHRIPALSHSIVIAPGIAHGFHFQIPSTMLYGVDEYWNLDDELGCMWNDPGLGLTWPCSSPTLSERDQTAGSLEQLLHELTARFESPPSPLT